MRRHSRARNVTALLAMSLVGLPAYVGCSYVFVQAPREDQHGVPHASDCTSSPAAPIADSVLMATYLASTLYVGTEDAVANKGEAVALGLAMSAAWLSSAIYGYYYTAECRDLKDVDGRDLRQGRIPRTVLSGPPSSFRSPEPPQSSPPPVR